MRRVSAIAGHAAYRSEDRQKPKDLRLVFCSLNDVNYLNLIRHLNGSEEPLNNLISEGRYAKPFRKEMVERIGIEPMTPCLQSRCSPS